MKTGTTGRRQDGEAVFSLEGMHCGNCAARIEAGLRAVPGIEHVSVSLSAGTASVTYDPALLDLETIRTKIEELGYKALEANK